MNAIGKILLTSQDGTFEAGRIALLEKIDETGSISQASTAVGISYKAAWDAIDKMNNLAEEPLVTKVAGGRRGGGTRLTPYAHRLIKTFYALADTRERLIEELDMPQSTGLSFYLSSTKNLFTCCVAAINRGDVSASISLSLRGEDTLVSVLTNDSVKRMNLETGDRVYALVPEGAVTLLKGDGRNLVISARNRLMGKVSRIQSSGVSAEVEIRLAGGHAIYTMVTAASIGSMDLQEGDTVTALFKARGVMLLK